MTLDDIHGENTTTVNGIGAWSEKGIVGRGVLIDYHTWRVKNNIAPEYNPFKSGTIPLKHLKEVLKEQRTELKFGDILIIRSGYMDAYNRKERSEIAELVKATPPSFTGVEQSEEMLQWIWENFSAVAGDHPSFECWRKYCTPEGLGEGLQFPASQREFMLHEVLLAGWGCPIGELFDLEALAEECKKQNRWSFFVTSEVCNVCISSFLATCFTDFHAGPRWRCESTKHSCYFLIFLWMLHIIEECSVVRLYWSPS